MAGGRTRSSQLERCEAEGVEAHHATVGAVGTDPTEHGLLLGAVGQRGGCREGGNRGFIHEPSTSSQVKFVKRF